MAKVTRLGWGADGSNADDPNYFDEQEEKWAGKHSPTSTGKPVSSRSRKQAGARKRARTTAPPSKKGPGASSTASLTASFGKADG
jgi:hypothetical protein